jgi:hypothetical protein
MWTSTSIAGREPARSAQRSLIRVVFSEVVRNWKSESGNSASNIRERFPGQGSGAAPIYVQSGSNFG